MSTSYSHWLHRVQQSQDLVQELKFTDFFKGKPFFSKSYLDVLFPTANISPAFINVPIFFFPSRSIQNIFANLATYKQL